MVLALTVVELASVLDDLVVEVAVDVGVDLASVISNIAADAGGMEKVYLV